MNYDKAIKESQQLIDENESLRNRLRDVVNSPLSDAEKQQIIDDSQQRLHSSAPASIALPNVIIFDISFIICHSYCVVYLFTKFVLFYIYLKEIRNYVRLIQLFRQFLKKIQNDGEGSSCLTTPDWDKHSSSSEVSVACLQDKIIQV